ncbi:MAG: hypothetical protein LBD99_05165 [Candidatus Margulisbacteria bacterium]|jgi:hypothetical protein|nr:hypothetical protein [Candidatus Margulisiibacteriota bacterium]
MTDYSGLSEEELKNRIARDFFPKYDCAGRRHNIDFIVEDKGLNVLYAEAKNKPADVCAMFAQLILTIGKARAYNHTLPPPFLGAFDSAKIVFLPYHAVQDIFYLNDFNWKVAPSDHGTREFKLARDKIQKIVEKEKYEYHWHKDGEALQNFIKKSLVSGQSSSGKVKIDKNNFTHIYLRWLAEVKPIINCDWNEVKKADIQNCDFYRADLFVDDKNTDSIDDDTPIKNKLFVIFRDGHYEIAKNKTGSMFDSSIYFRPGGKTVYEQFWKKYKRPPLTEFQDFIVDRRDLLVGQDVRERKGAYFTPGIWVEKSQEYLAKVFGENWQDEYYVWDCAAGTGNLLVGLTNKYHIWASDYDAANIATMRERINNGALLLKDHVFKFDFLNDDFCKLPAELKKIIDDPRERKKLIIYINPPYAETMSKGKKHKAGVNQTLINTKYINLMGHCANRELFVQFLTRIYCEIPDCKIANFSTLKNLQSPNFLDFRRFFLAKLEKLFIVPADTFDNVNGQFPIGFFIWDASKKKKFKQISADVYKKIDAEAALISTKSIYCYDNDKLFINQWIISTRNRVNENKIGFLSCLGNDFQHNNIVFIMNNKNQMAAPRGSYITDKNLTEVAIYFAVRHCIESDWLNDRDQFLYPNDGWQADTEFQNDCLAYALFNNNIQSKFGTNHWMPFTEKEVRAREKFDSSFMTDFMAGRLPHTTKDKQMELSNVSRGAAKGSVSARKQKLEFSPEALAVFDAGRELWRYYHAQPGANVNASLHDIREYFQGRNAKGKMNNKSNDAQYMELIKNLRQNTKILAEKIIPKVYDYGFLRE